MTGDILLLMISAKWKSVFQFLDYETANQHISFKMNRLMYLKNVLDVIVC